MPSYTGAEIAEEARNVHLNRAGVSDLAILPIINAEYERLQSKLIEHGVPSVKKTFAAITVSIGATTIPLGGGAGQLPNDFVEPIFLHERPNGGLITDYVPMSERRNLPKINQAPELVYWSWDEEVIQLVGATTARQVQISGYKSLPLLTTLQSTITINNSKGYLAVATAARAALTVSHNPTLASALRETANQMLDEMLGKYARKGQSLSIRRRAFRRPGG